MNNALNNEEHNEHHFYFRFRLPCFHWPWESITFPFTTLSLRFWIVFEYPCFIPSYDRVKQVLFSLQTLGNVLANMTLCCFWYSERIFETIFAHNLRISKFSVRIFHTVSLPMESFSKIILTVSRRSTRTSCFTRSMLHQFCLHQPARSLIILTFFSTFSKSFVPFKSTSS